MSRAHEQRRVVALRTARSVPACGITDSGLLMTPSHRLIACTLIVGSIAAAAHAASPMPVPRGPSPNEVAIAAKCKAASFARHPAGRMATTMRDFEIKRCIKNGGVLY
jgi:hypothetical protein